LTQSATARYPPGISSITVNATKQQSFFLRRITETTEFLKV
jgi:hypothetical protein